MSAVTALSLDLPEIPTAVFVNTLEQLKPEQPYDTHKTAWKRAYRALKEEGRILVDDAFTVRLPT